MTRTKREPVVYETEGSHTTQSLIHLQDKVEKMAVSLSLGIQLFETKYNNVKVLGVGKVLNKRKRETTECIFIKPEETSDIEPIKILNTWRVSTSYANVSFERLHSYETPKLEYIVKEIEDNFTLFSRQVNQYSTEEFFRQIQFYKKTIDNDFGYL